MYVSYSKYCSLCVYVCIQEGVREGQESGQSLQESLDAIEVSKLRVFALNPDTFSCIHTVIRFFFGTYLVPITFNHGYPCNTIL